MPATATGRGAQVIVDPGSDTEKAIRGAFAATLEANLAKVRSDRISGTFASGDTTSDGTTTTGARATDPVHAPSSAPGVARTLYINGTIAGNGADLTEDTLMTFDIPANTLVNIGDTIRIFASGNFGGTTDSKTARIKFGAANTSQPSAAIASAIKWSSDVYVVKTGTTTHTWASVGTVFNAATGGTSSGTTSVNDGVVTTISVTGQNATNSVASSVSCQLLLVQYIPGP